MQLGEVKMRFSDCNHQLQSDQCSSVCLSNHDWPHIYQGYKLVYGIKDLCSLITKNKSLIPY